MEELKIIHIEACSNCGYLLNVNANFCKYTGTASSNQNIRGYVETYICNKCISKERDNKIKMLYE